MRELGNDEAAYQGGLGGKLVEKQVSCRREQDRDDRYHSVEQNLQGLLAHVGPYIFPRLAISAFKGDHRSFQKGPLGSERDQYPLAQSVVTRWNCR